MSIIKLEVVLMEISNSAPKDFIRINNVSLCSERNPLFEAKNWHEYYSTGFLQTNYIIGLGCGFHVAYCAMAHSDKNFYVIDFHQELKDFFYKKYTDQFKNVAIIIINKPEDILEHYSLLLNIGKPIKSFLFRPATLHHLDPYMQLQDHVTGRSYLAVKKLIESEMVKLDFVPEKQGPISMQDIINTHPRQDLYIKTLSELIK